MFSDGDSALRFILNYASYRKEHSMSMTDSDWVGIETQRRHDMGECLDNPGSICPICETEVLEDLGMIEKEGS